MQQGPGTKVARGQNQEVETADLNQLRQPPTLPGNEALRIFIEEVEMLNPNCTSSQFSSNPKKLEKGTPHALVFGVKGAKDRFLLEFANESAMNSFKKEYFSHRREVSRREVSGTEVSGIKVSTPRTFLLNGGPITDY
jgi:hypothetical protein